MRSGPNDSVSAGDAVSPADPGSLGAPGLAVRARGLLRAARKICGMPDYETYLAHRAASHPGEPVLTRAAFVALAIDRKYGNSGPRCC